MGFEKEKNWRRNVRREREEEKREKGSGRRTEWKLGEERTKRREEGRKTLMGCEREKEK